MKSIREIAARIVADQCCVYTNDAGQGSFGPCMIESATLADLIESELIDDYQLVEEREADEIIDATLAALLPHRYDLALGVRWIVVRRTADERGRNPYRHYLLLWE
jgi:hypothetical protein